MTSNVAGAGPRCCSTAPRPGWVFWWPRPTASGTRWPLIGRYIADLWLAADPGHAGGRVRRPPARHPGGQHSLGRSPAPAAEARRTPGLRLPHLQPRHRRHLHPGRDQRDPRPRLPAHPGWGHTCTISTHYLHTIYTLSTCIYLC